MLRRIMNRPTEKKRLFFAFFLSLFLILGSFSFAFAAPSNERKVVKVGYYGYENFLNVDGNGNYSGYIYEYLNDIAEYTGWKYQFVYGTLEECLDRLESGEIDLITSLLKSPERENKFAFSKNHVGMIYTVLCVTQNRKDIYYEDFAKFNGLKVGVLGGSTIRGNMEAYAAQNNFRATYIDYATSAQMFNALHAGEIDAVATSSFASIGSEKVVARFFPKPGYFIAKKSNSALLDSIDEACGRIFVENTRYNELLQDKYYGSSATFQLSFTREEADFLKIQPELVVAYDSSWQPVAYYDEEDKAAKGIAIDFLRYIADKSGLKFKFIKTEHDLKCAQIVSAGGADIVCGYDQAMGDDRVHNMGISKTYLQLPLSFISLKGNVPDSIFNVGVAANRIGIRDNLAKDFPRAVTVHYNSLEEALDAVRDGDIEYLVDNTYILQKYLQEPGNENLQLLPYGHKGQLLGFGLSLERNQQLLNIFNKIITNMRPEERSHILIPNIAQAPYHLTFSILVKKYLYQIVASTALLFFGLMGYFFLLEKRKKNELEKIAFYDRVTGAKNFEKFKIDAADLVKSGNYLLVMFDVNRFKLVTTAFGVKEGRRLLRQICRNMESVTAGNEFFAHGSNDLFMLLLKDTGDSQIREKLMRLQEEINRDMVLRKAPYTISLSFGVYRPTAGEEDLEKMIELVDLARIEAKKGQENSIVFYKTDLGEKILREGEIENRMEQALLNHEFVVYFQPKYDLRTGSAAGAEALVRWITDSGMILPGDFISIFERNGFIVKLDFYVFEKVCAIIRQQLDRGLKVLPVAVNVSRLHLLHPGFIDDYHKVIDKYQVPPELLELELTEYMPLATEDILIETLNDLKKLGVKLAMDDFGSGYSSLNVLHNMPFDTLKIDRLFFQDKTGSDRGRRIIETIVFMAQKLGMEVVAEGVETKGQADFLKAIGCNWAQGYFFAKPMPLEEYENLLGSENF